MKKLVLFTILISSTCFSQTIGKIYFRNGEIFEGKVGFSSRTFGAITKNEVSYIPEEDIKIIKGFSDIEKIEYINKEENKVERTYYFKKNKNKEMLILLAGSTKNFDIFIDYVIDDMGSVLNFGPTPPTGTHVTEVYYIGKKYATAIEKLPQNKKRKKYSNIILKYASKCEKFSQQVNVDQLKKKDIKDLIDEYNKICN